MNSATQAFLGRYRLVKVLGQGAMGVVYEAVDTRLNRTVAIKTVLRSHLVDDATASEYTQRFEREAQAAARLSHPHVVAVYDFGEHEDISYIVMEFIRGRELNQVFESGERVALPEAIRMMRELLEALDYAHRQGVVHRDIKPANVMLDAGDHVKLTDFGVARVASANQDRTMPGTLVGTPSYMSPEQILGTAVGSRADIFAAGVILYQFLTGRKPFSGGGPFAVQRKIVQDDPEPASALNPALPPGFDLIVSRALAKQPEDRYESAAAFLRGPGAHRRHACARGAADRPRARRRPSRGTGAAPANGAAAVDGRAAPVQPEPGDGQALRAGAAATGRGPGCTAALRPRIDGHHPALPRRRQRQARAGRASARRPGGRSNQAAPGRIGRTRSAPSAVGAAARPTCKVRRGGRPARVNAEGARFDGGAEVGA
jgi:tRNA A-37 threonylcarbamoyl transferase component Bud32